MESSCAHSGGMEGLVDRLNSLELLVFGDVTSNESVKDIPHNLNDIESVAKSAEDKFYELEHYVKMKKTYDDLVDTLQSVETSDSVGTAAKRSIVLAAHDNLLQTSSLLKAQTELQPCINPPYLKDIPENQDRLESLHDSHLEAATLVAVQHQRVEQLLDVYDKAIATASEKFVLWDGMLSEWEDKLNQAVVSS